MLSFNQQLQELKQNASDFQASTTAALSSHSDLIKNLQLQFSSAQEVNQEYRIKFSGSLGNHSEQIDTLRSKFPKLDKLHEQHKEAASELHLRCSRVDDIVSKLRKDMLEQQLHVSQ